jgi:hypothetical protein
VVLRPLITASLPVIEAAQIRLIAQRNSPIDVDYVHRGDPEEHNVQVDIGSMKLDGELIRIWVRSVYKRTQKNSTG